MTLPKVKYVNLLSNKARVDRSRKGVENLYWFIHFFLTLSRGKYYEENPLGKCSFVCSCC